MEEDKMNDLISRQEAIDELKKATFPIKHPIFGIEMQMMNAEVANDRINTIHPDPRLKKIADLVDGTIDHFDRDDAMDLLYQIKEVLKNG